MMQANIKRRTSIMPVSHRMVLINEAAPFSEMRQGLVASCTLVAGPLCLRSTCSKAPRSFQITCCLHATTRLR
jgi:hypothetical protein